MKILVTPTSFKPDKPTAALDKLKGFADEIIYNPFGRPLTADELIPMLDGCDGYIAGLDYVNAKVMESCKSLKVISRYGAGVDRVDIMAAAANGIYVCNTPGANAQAVADLALGLMLCVARKIPMLDSKTKNGSWVRSTGIELYKKSIGILGLGAIGKGVAKRAQGFSMKVYAYDPFMNHEYAKANDITPLSFDEILEKADILSLHLPLNNETKHIIDRSAICKMKKGAIIINTARGGLIDEDAACDMLKSGHIAGMGLDAYEIEPPEKSPLFELDNVVMTPHTGSHTVEATLAMADMAVQNLIDILSVGDCPYIIKA